MTPSELSALDKWIVHEDGEPLKRGRKPKPPPELTEAQRTEKAQLERYQKAMMEVMPTQADRKRCPAKPLFETLCQEVYDALEHIPNHKDLWDYAQHHVWTELCKSQRLTAGEYAYRLLVATIRDGQEIDEAWQETAHHADKDDKALKRLVWTIYKSEKKLIDAGYVREFHTRYN